MTYKKCPRCETNYILESEDYCDICRETWSLFLIKQSLTRKKSKQIFHVLFAAVYTVLILETSMKNFAILSDGIGIK